MFKNSLLSFFMILVLIASGFSQDELWDDQFILGGFDGYVYATVVAQNGDIYVGGQFNLLNGIVVNGIAMWNGEEWNTLESGVTSVVRNDGRGIVYAIAIDGDNIYIGGSFTMAGETEANNIAMWDGANWHALGSGVDREIHALAVDGGNVYVGGYGISEAGGVSVSNVAKWDGQIWSAMGGGVSNFNFVEAMAAKNDTVYVGGFFKEAGEDTVNYITFWDGSKWNSMDNGMNDRVNSLVFGNDLLYAGGEFTEAGGVTANFIAQWDGSQWDPVGEGVNSTVSSMSVNGSDLYLGGRFIMADTINAARIVKWDGENWHSLGAGIADPDQLLSYRVYAIAVDGDNVYAGGDFVEVAGKQNEYFAQWNGQSWSELGRIQDKSVDGSVYAMATNGTDVYVGGLFTMAGGDTVNNIAKWDGQNWSALGKGFNDKVSSLVVHNGELYAGGRFTTTGDMTINRIARWDGEKWDSLSVQGINGEVKAMAFYGDDLYAGGSFTSAGSVFARRIGRWDGAEWYALGGDGSLEGAGGLDGYIGSYVSSIEVDRDTLYIGGFFGRAFYQDGEGFERVKSIVKWDGEKWHALNPFHESITQQIVFSMIVRDGIIHVAGKFPRFGDWPASKVVKYDGVDWTDVGDEMYFSGSPSFGNTLHSLVEVNGNIYVGGEPDLVGEKQTNFVIKWDGQEWSSLGSGVNDHVFTLAANSNFLYVGGRFTLAGNKASARIARYDISGVTALKSTPLIVAENYFLYQNYPNPFNPITTINYNLPKAGDVKLTIFNILGQSIKTLYSGRQKAGHYSVQWDASSASSGVYFYRLKTGNRELTRKMMLIR